MQLVKHEVASAMNCDHITFALRKPITTGPNNEQLALTYEMLVPTPWRKIMRSMSRAALVLAAIILVPAALHAQISLGIAGGLAMPTGDASDAVKSGYNVTAALGIKPPVAPIGLRLDGMWNSFDNKTQGVGASRVVAGTANVTLSAPMIPMAYAIAGAGMYHSSVSGVANSGDTKFGFNGGLGLNLPLTGFSTFVEARYHHVKLDNGSFQFVPVTFGLRF